MANVPELRITFATTVTGVSPDEEEGTISIHFAEENGDRRVVILPASQLDTLTRHIERAREQLPAPFGPQSRKRRP